VRHTHPIFTSPSEKNNYDKRPRLFLGFDGTLHVSDHLGTRPASGLALTLLAAPSRRAVGFRDGEVNNG
jgi:hypothetical protein